MYEVGAGQIAIDGQNVVSVSRASLRRQIAYVGQDIFLFRGTIRENIGFGGPNPTEEQIIAAAAAAHAHEFITTFPKGYETPVGEHGLQLSTGQRQRVSIARALLKDAPLILLDQPTTAIDSESERHVQDAIARLCSERTTMVIAHRLQTIMHADRILFVEHGAVVESGSHQELLRRGGRYAAFYHCNSTRNLCVDAPLSRHSPAICEPLADKHSSRAMRFVANRASAAKFAKAFALHKHGRLHEAELAYAAILKRDPSQVDALHRLGLIKKEQGRKTEAHALLTAALARCGDAKPGVADSVDLLIKRGEILHALDRYFEAVVSYDRALTLAPDRADCHVNRGFSLYYLPPSGGACRL